MSAVVVANAAVDGTLHGSHDFVKFQMAQGLEKGGGVGNAPAEMAVGYAMAQQMMQQQGGILAQSTPPAAPPPLPGVGAPAQAAGATMTGTVDLMAPADAARVLGVAEADVLSAIQDGSLKAKKIGNAFRITRAALDEFLKS